jgi:hypothetical protein
VRRIFSSSSVFFEDCTCCTRSAFSTHWICLKGKTKTPFPLFHFHLSVRTFRKPSVENLSPLLKFAARSFSGLILALLSCWNSPSASSQALPAPKPVPSHTGHALLLNSRTENMTPKEKPRPDLITREDIARSHCRVNVSNLILPSSCQW